MCEYKSVEEVLTVAKTALGKPLREFDIKGRFSSRGNKGNIGQVIEEGLFGYDINSKQEADFKELGIELKVSPYKITGKKKLISAKERLVLTIINYMQDYDKDFIDSNCYHKMEKILMMFYEHEKDKNRYDYVISKIYLYMYSHLSEEDKNIILQDYLTIINKIKKGEAHLISESDTFYLGACTKGATAEKSMRRQPFSEIKARQRAFSLKSSYMTEMLRSDIFKRKSLVKNSEILKSKTLKDIIEDSFKPFYEKTLSEIDTLIDMNIDRNSKQYIKTYISRMLASDEADAEDLNEFRKANIKIKTIRVNKRGKIKESMSFPAFKFKELVNEEWENSTLRNRFTEEKYLLCVFREIDNEKKEYLFNGAFIWSMPESILDTEVCRVWDTARSLAVNGIEFKVENNRKGQYVINNLPKHSESNVIHVRPHASKSIYVFNDGTSIGSGNISTDGDELPDGTIITKQCFFLNNGFIKQIIMSKYPEMLL